MVSDSYPHVIEEAMKLAFVHGPMREERHMLPADLPVVVIEYQPDTGYSAEQLRQLAGCDALYATHCAVPAQVFQACHRLKMVQCSGTGYDGIDLAAATRHGVLCCNNADTNSGRTADFSMMVVLNLLRNYLPTVIGMDGGRAWEVARREGIAALEVEGKTLGILGFGDIGHKLALRAHAFGMNILYCDVNKNAHQTTAQRLGAKRVGRNELCRRADVISVNVPLDARTRNMLSDREFALMKDGVFIVSTARGGVIDEQALRQALDSGKVAGAAMDVFSAEPIRLDNPLVGAPRTWLTPHVASRGKEGVLRSFHLGIANIRRFIEGGKMPLNILNPKVRPDLMKAATPTTAKKNNRKVAVKKRPYAASKLRKKPAKGRN